eukprot:UN30083
MSPYSSSFMSPSKQKAVRLTSMKSALSPPPSNAKQDVEEVVIISPSNSNSSPPPQHSTINKHVR